MKIPKFIKCGGHLVTIKKVPPSDITGPGEYNDFYKLIRIEDDIDAVESRQAETLLHELIECIKRVNNLELSHVDLTVISESLFSIIRDNNLDFRAEKVEKAE